MIAGPILSLKASVAVEHAVTAENEECLSLLGQGDSGA
jgi:hypothetical protein